MRLLRRFRCRIRSAKPLPHSLRNTMLKPDSTSGSAIARIPRRWRAADLSEETIMSDPENLLARWSRRKSDSRPDARGVDAPVQDSQAVASDAGVVAPGETPPVDLASLPALDSIGAETDLRAFLGRGVPAELTRAALRRGWSADPAIRDFIGLSENSWDFNAPGGIPGFGTLDAGEIQKLLAQLTGEGETTAPTSTAPPPLQQAASPPTECAAGSEVPREVSANDLDSGSGQSAVGHSVSVQNVSEDGVNAATSTAQSIDDGDGRT